MNQRQQTKSSPKKSQLTDQQKAEQTAKDKRAEKRLTELLGSAEFVEGRVSSDVPAFVNARLDARRCAACLNNGFCAQDVRALAVTGEVLRGEGKHSGFLAPKCRPLSQSAGFAEAYVAQTDLPSDHLQHIKNLVSAVLLAFAAVLHV